MQSEIYFVLPHYNASQGEGGEGGGGEVLLFYFYNEMALELGNQM